MASAKSPIVAGAALAIAAAVLFGATMPWLKRAGAGVGPFSTAALLYAGAAAVALVTRRRSDEEAPLRFRHAPRLIGIALLGARHRAGRPRLGPRAPASGASRRCC